ncbi:MAG: amidophosphoribosyltransferase [Candidatus Muiribacteriota bacterium]
MTLYGLQEECGIFGIISPEFKKLANLTYYGLYSLQHRGQESAGIAVSDTENISSMKEMGLVSEVFDEEHLERMRGNLAIGHVRYTTSGSSSRMNVQPIISTFKYGTVAIAHNGNITNADYLKKELEDDGAIFQTDSDTEILLHLISRSSQNNFLNALRDELCKLEGAFSFVIIHKDKLIAVKDKKSIRPLCIGRLKKKIVISSETCALDMIGAKLIREMEPAEVYSIDLNGNEEIFKYEKNPQINFCVFEYIYFARPDSTFFNINVHEARKKMGRILARKHPVKADLVIPVPDSGISAALGYSEESKIPYEKGIIRNHYIGRTFINPTQELRNMKVKMKLNCIKSVIEGKKVVLIDDSIVRGTTSKKIVKLVKEAGAEEVHVRISSPPVLNPCFFGMDTREKDELIANSRSVEDIRRYIKAHSLEYIHKNELLKCFENLSLCHICF